MFTPVFFSGIYPKRFCIYLLNHIKINIDIFLRSQNSLFIKDTVPSNRQ